MLRSSDALSKAACRLLPMLGIEGVTKVTASVGAEQEYFLVLDEYYQQRMDLKLTEMYSIWSNGTKRTGIR